MAVEFPREEIEARRKISLSSRPRTFAALAGRFADRDLASILAHQQAGPTGPTTRASETHSLQPGTAGWASFGTTTSTGDLS